MKKIVLLTPVESYNKWIYSSPLLFLCPAFILYKKIYYYLTYSVSSH